MSDSFIKNIKIRNFKSFVNLNDGIGLNLAVPDGLHAGSGLTVLIGENSSGKSSIASAIRKIRLNEKIGNTEKNNDNDVEIIFENSSGKTFIIKNRPGASIIDRTDMGFTLTSDSIDLIKDNRVWTSTSSGSSGYTYNSLTEQTDTKRSTTDTNLARRLAAIDESEPDKKQKIDEILKAIAPDFKSWNLIYDTRSGDYIGYELASTQKLDIDESLGGGILNLFRIAVAIVEAKPIIFIDEPEAFLHPDAQIKLSNVLMDSSKNRQIIISTHSPYMFKNAISGKAKLHLFTKNKVSGQSSSEDSRSIGWGLFGLESPTWGEINYFAYNLPTIEFHNELFGFAQAKAIKIDSNNEKEYNFDLFLLQHGFTQNMMWVKEINHIPQAPLNRTLQTYIRNYIHHPENTHNAKYSDAQLSESSAELIGLLRKLP